MKEEKKIMKLNLEDEKQKFNAKREREELGIVATETNQGRPKNKKIVRDNSVQAGLTADWTRATFIVRVSHLQKLKDFAYTERISIKEALDVALERFLQDRHDLLSHDKELHGDEILRIDGEKSYTVKEVAEILNRSIISVLQYIRSGKLEAKKIGTTLFITAPALKKFAENF